MMDYSKLSNEEAYNEIRTHESFNPDVKTSEIISPQDVLYYLDAFGDLSMAINLQGLPKDLPDSLYEGIDEYDVFNDWCGKVDEHECPGCRRDLYEFDWKATSLVFDEYGDEHSNELSILTDPAGYMWDAVGDHRFLCAVCSRGGIFPRHGEEWGVKAFYGEDNAWYDFRHSGGVVKRDSFSSNDNDCYPKNLHDSKGRLVHFQEIEKAFATGRKAVDGLMQKLGFQKLTPQSVRVETPGLRKAKRFAGEVLSEWAKAPYEYNVENTNPDLNFTYIIEDGNEAYVHMDNVDKFLYELGCQVLLRAGADEKLDEHLEKGVDS